MVAVMAILEAPAIILGGGTFEHLQGRKNRKISDCSVVSHPFTNGSVLLTVASLLMGWIVIDSQTKGRGPFTTDSSKGFLAIFLLDMGISSGKKLGDLFHHEKFALTFSILMPLFNGVVVGILSG